MKLKQYLRWYQGEFKDGQYYYRLMNINLSSNQEKKLLLGCNEFKPLKVREEEIPEPAEIVFNIKKLDEMIVRKELVSATGEDNILMIVKKYIQDGWPDMITHQIEMKPYWAWREGLSSAKYVIWWRSRIVIPRKLQSRTMILLHEAHPGLVGMKSLARSYFWFSIMDLNIEAVVKECVGCQKNYNKPNMNEYSSRI